MSVIAAIDVGTNSFHLVVASVDDDGHFEVLTREREPVRLGRAPSKVADPANSPGVLSVTTTYAVKHLPRPESAMRRF